MSWRGLSPLFLFHSSNNEEETAVTSQFYYGAGRSLGRACGGADC